MLERNKDIHILEALRQNNYKVNETARSLGMLRRTFLRRLRALGIPPAYSGTGPIVDARNRAMLELAVTRMLEKLRGSTLPGHGGQPQTLPKDEI